MLQVSPPEYKPEHGELALINYLALKALKTIHYLQTKPNK